MFKRRPSGLLSLKPYAPNTTKRMLAALRGVLKECWRLGRITHDEYARAADIAPVRGQLPPRGRALNDTELETLFRACQADHAVSGIRDAAILCILYGTGSRRSELVRLDIVDFDSESGCSLSEAKASRRGRHMSSRKLEPFLIGG